MQFMEKGLVIRHNQMSRDMFEMEFIAPGIAQECTPGQFVHIRSTQENFPLLRRPLSLYDVDKRLGSITLLYRVVGKGTALFSRVKPKEYVDVMGPLGRGFSLKENISAVLVGGGVGIAPLLFLARELKARDGRVKVLYGVDSLRNLVALEKLRGLGVDLLPATVDGSAGFKGTVVDLLEKKVNPAEIDMVYCCGPEAMMAAVAALARNHGLAGEVSLEESMACGVGACLGCARKLKPDDAGYVKICKDGPVFPIHEVYGL